MIFSVSRSLGITAFLILAAITGSAQRPELVVQTGHSGGVAGVAFSSDGKLLASAGGDNTIKLWEVSTGTELRTFRGHAYSVNSVAFSPDGKTIASGSVDRTIKFWDVATGSRIADA